MPRHDNLITLDNDPLWYKDASMPAYMVPAGIGTLPGPLPRNPNGKIDRKWLASDWTDAHD
jgi:hypothetical protein